MGVNNNYRWPNKAIEMSERFLKDLVDIVENCVNGKTNNCGEVTLGASITSTDVENILCNENSVILLQPITANAANLTDVYVTADDKTFTITHPSDANTDLTFRYVIVG